ncbi:hypothetical protein FHS43_005388 [Streptosporangium becharense]|uniref:Cytochrome bc1 complex cytochrome b subunit n=1 Tax=Streptosporangium becharense TaxID=1816182 RepID=A0A7W9IBJ5_9ACTN|nr:hypothetical protein [Streptosporangium becharense]MBB2914076.1 hypothetical protein [Streptosporangium becharense]MBB5817103.1 hypothetical protein [Streptosporangium becharense]
MSEMLVYCFVVVLLTGAFLVLFYTPSDRVIYDGSYEPLRGVEMSAAYIAELTTRFEVRGGLLIQQLHQWSSLVFLAGIVLRAVPTRAFRQLLPGLVLLGTGVLTMVTGHALTGGLAVGENPAGVPIPWLYGIHLLLGLTTAAALVIVWRQTRTRWPKRGYFIMVCLGLTLAAVVVPFI